jgi:cytochrome P450
VIWCCWTTAQPTTTAAFIDPERFDISCPAVPHLSFGHGARYCIGAPLARIELQSVFSQLVPRFPGMRLAEPAAQLTSNRDTLAGGLARLPVTW